MLLNVILRLYQHNCMSMAFFTADAILRRAICLVKEDILVLDARAVLAVSFIV